MSVARCCPNQVSIFGATTTVFHARSAIEAVEGDRVRIIAHITFPNHRRALALTGNPMRWMEWMIEPDRFPTPGGTFTRYELYTAIHELSLFFYHAAWRHAGGYGMLDCLSSTPKQTYEPGRGPRFRVIVQ